MGMFCQAFTSSPVFFPNGCMRTELTKTFDEVVYELRHNICGDGNVRSSVPYDCDKYDNLHIPRKDETVIQNIYRSPNVNIDVDLCMDSNGYYPEGGSKKMYSEFVFMISHLELVGTKIVGRSICTNSITIAKANLRTSS